MLRRVRWPHHLVVVFAVVAATTAAWFGLIGTQRLPERFDAKLVVIAPAGDDALRITEYVDQDFGDASRRGYRRTIPDDLGRVEALTASSPDAPDDLTTIDLGDSVEIRVGNPDITVTGQHRYELSYTYPDAALTSRRLALDVIGTDETLETARFEVVVTGLELAALDCDTGAIGQVGGCTFLDDGTSYRAVISPLAPGAGITISGDIVGRRPPAVIDPPPIPERRAPSGSRVPISVGSGTATLLAALGVLAYMRRRGRNEVSGTNAADAAWGAGTRVDLPPPATTAELIDDDRLAEFATIEFVPPGGIEPWQGAVLLGERLDDDSVAAWFSGLAGHGVITIEESDDGLRIGNGPRRGEVDAPTAELLEQLFAGSDSIELDGYDARFARQWRAIQQYQEREIAARRWWRRFGPHRPTITAPTTLLTLGAFAVVLITIALAVTGGVTSGIGAVIVAAVFGAATATIAYRGLLPARTALGSALALRTESFRRFLEQSEGHYVQWAWENGLIREYSGWAVALGAAAAWQRALTASALNIDQSALTPLLVYTSARTFTSAKTAPSSSSSSGGSSGGVGSGGGGGSSGSW